MTLKIPICKNKFGKSSGGTTNLIQSSEKASGFTSGTGAKDLMKFNPQNGLKRINKNLSNFNQNIGDLNNKNESDNDKSDHVNFGFL